MTTASHALVPSRNVGLDDSCLDIAGIDSADLAAVANIAALFVLANLDDYDPVIPGVLFSEAQCEIRTIRSANPDVYWELLDPADFLDDLRFEDTDLAAISSEYDDLDDGAREYFEDDFVAFERLIKRSIRQAYCDQTFDQLVYDNFRRDFRVDSPCLYLATRFKQVANEFTQDALYLYSDISATLAARYEMPDPPDVAQSIYLYDIYSAKNGPSANIASTYVWPELMLDVKSADADALRRNADIDDSPSADLPPALDRIVPGSNAEKARLYRLFLTLMRDQDDPAGATPDRLNAASFIECELIPRVTSVLTNLEDDVCDRLCEATNLLNREVWGTFQRLVDQ